MKKTYHEQFSSHNECFEKVWKSLPIGLKPTWQHYWFYRYLQISPSYWEWSKIINLYDAGKKIDSESFRHIPNIELVAQTYNTFDDVWELDFPRWWYLIARFQFVVNLSDGDYEITQLFRVSKGKKIPKNEINEGIKKINSLFLGSNRQDFYPETIGLIIPIKKSRKETLKSIDKFLTKNISFGKDSRVDANYQIFKSKIREKTVSACFKVLELRALQKKPNLIDLAIEANVLDGAMADLKFNNYKLDKINSIEALRSGTSRQIAIAINLAENAARGKFPCSQKIELMEPDYIELNDIFSRLIKKEKYRDNNFRSGLRDIKNILKYPESKEWHSLVRI